MNQRADRYRRLSQRFTEILAAVLADRWQAPSPCDGWSALDVVAHVVRTQAEFLTRMGFESPTVDESDVLATWPAVRDAVQTRLDHPADAEREYDGWFGRTTFEATIDTFYSMDLTVHGWDVARATDLGPFLQIPGDELATIRAAVEQLGDSARMPGVFGPALPVTDDADEQTRLLADIGRKA